jgi:EVE domain
VFVRLAATGVRSLSVDRSVSGVGPRRARAPDQPGVGAVHYVSLMTTRRHWVIVASRDHARRGVNGGFVMADHGKRSPMARMSPGDRVLIY